ncbi:MAG: hypothetical protein ACTSVY_11885 [Candidatus Helarchaeota archaeon]
MILITCPLCGSEIDPLEKACKTCPLTKGCNKVCCPNCGYEFIPEHINMIKFYRKIQREKAK